MTSADFPRPLGGFATSPFAPGPRGSDLGVRERGSPSAAQRRPKTTYAVARLRALMSLEEAAASWDWSGGVSQTFTGS